MEDRCIGQDSDDRQKISVLFGRHGIKQCQKQTCYHHASYKPKRRIHMQVGKAGHLETEHIRNRPIQPSNKLPQTESFITEQIQQNNRGFIQKCHSCEALPGVSERSKLFAPCHMLHLIKTCYQKKGVNSRQATRNFQTEMLNGNIISEQKAQNFNVAVYSFFRIRSQHDGHSLSDSQG